MPSGQGQAREAVTWVTMSAPEDDAPHGGRAIGFEERVLAKVSQAMATLSWVPRHIVWVLNAASAIAGLVVALIWQFPTDQSGWAYYHSIAIGLVAVAALCLVLSGVIAAAIDKERATAAEVRIQARIQAHQSATEVIIPTLRSIAKMLTIPGSMKQSQFDKTLSQVWTARGILFGNDQQVRMVIYQLIDAGVTSEHRELSVVDHQGREKDEPNPFKDKDRGRGSRVFKWLDEDRPQPRFVPDIADLEDVELKGSGTGYNTYISVPITGPGDEPGKLAKLGMLTVDAPRSGTLRKTDIPMLRVMAYAISIAFLLVRQ